MINKKMERVYDDSTRRLVVARKRIRDLMPRKREHVCSHEHCAPLNELYFMNQGYLAPPLISAAVYLCRYGAVHVCTPNTCVLYLENPKGICPISGVSYGGVYQTGYDKEDSRTWYQKPQTHVINEVGKRQIIRKKRSRSMLTQSGSIFRKVTITEKVVEETVIVEGEKNKKKKRKPKVQQPATVLEHKVLNILQTLLFSSLRTRFNQDITSQHKGDHKKEQERYLNTCKRTGQFPNLIDLLTISNHYNCLKLPMLNIEMDYVMREHYVKLVMQVWENVIKYVDDNATKVSIEAVTLGTMYTLRQGLVYNRIEMIPKDPFICQRGVLPLINDIVRFGFTKKTVTCGEKLIDAAYNKAIKMNVSKDDLMIDFSVMSQHNAEEPLMVALGKTGSGKRMFY